MPTRFNPDFLKSIKIQAADRLAQRYGMQRVGQEAPPDAPQQSGQPPKPVPYGQATEPPERDDDLQATQQKGLPDDRQDLTKDLTMPASGELVQVNRAPVKYRITYAGQNLYLLNMVYNGVSRLVEPYSYRTSGKRGALRFYGFCKLHNEIHSFNPDKIQSLLVTNQVYSPRWLVEL